MITDNVRVTTFICFFSGNVYSQSAGAPLVHHKTYINNNQDGKYSSVRFENRVTGFGIGIEPHGMDFFASSGAISSTTVKAILRASLTNRLTEVVSYQSIQTKTSIGILEAHLTSATPINYLQLHRVC